MTTSGTASFSMDLTEIVEEAFERAGGELRTGYDLRTASRSMNLMFSNWANRGLNMFTYEQGVHQSGGRHCYVQPPNRHGGLVGACDPHGRR